MPELPECERGRRILEAVAVGRTIERVRCDDDRIVFVGVTPRRFSNALTGRRAVAAHRRGKYIWLELDARPWPLFHFGMTGAFEVPGGTHLKLASDKKTDGERVWPPRFSKAHLFLDDGGELVMTNKRRLGRIRLVSDPAGQPPVSELGFDPLLDPPAPQEFIAMLARRSGTVKGLLLDQGFAAGVGNWIADEVLYQAKLDPRRSASSLTAVEAKRLRTKLIAVIAKAVDVDADKARFPRGWLFHHRWGKDAEARTSRGERIEHITVAGRTTAWCPAVQTDGTGSRRQP